MRSLLTLFAADDGATAVEYGLLVMVVSVTCLGIWASMGHEVRKPFETIHAAVFDVNH